MIRKFTPAWFFYGARNATQRFAERVPWLRGLVTRKFARVSFSQFGEDLLLRNLFPHSKGFYVDAGVFSRISARDAMQPEVGAAPFRKVKMRTRRLGDVLRECRVTQPIDFLSVDCEGHDLRVLQSNDWAAFRPKAIVVEDYDRSGTSPIVGYLASFGYEPLALAGMSRVFVCPSAFPATTAPRTRP